MYHMGYQEFKDVVSKSRFKDRLSDEALIIYLDYLEDYEESTGEEIEFDLIGLMSNVVEETLKEVQTDYYECPDKLEEAIDWLRERTEVYGVTKDGKIVYQPF